MAVAARDRGPRRRAARARPVPPRALLPGRRARDLRRRVRRAVPRARAASRTSSPSWSRPTHPPSRSGRRRRRRSREVEHVLPMLSLDNAFNLEDLLAWGKRIERQITDPVAFVCEPKMDGLAISLLYEDGQLVRAATRGNGFVGEDVTAERAHDQVRAEEAEGQRPPDRALEVRGEVFMPLKAFEDAQPPPGRSRGSAVRQPAQRRRRQPAPEGRAASPRQRALDIFCYQPGVKEGGPRLRTHAETLDWLRELGFPVNPTDRAVRVARRGVRVLRVDARAPPRPRLRDRRRRREGRRPRPARRARRDRARRRAGRSPTSSRPRRRPPAAQHHGEHRPHRPRHAVRAAGAGVRRRVDGRSMATPAQRGRGRPQGRARAATP